MLDTTFSRLVGGIYDAVVDPTLWSDAIDAIRREFRFHIAVMAVVKLPGGEFVVHAANNIPDQFLSTFAQYGEDIIEMWGGTQAVARLPLEEPMVMTEVRPIHLWQHIRYYTEWIKPQGLVDQVAMVLANDRTTNANLGLGCHASRGPVEPETLADLRLLAPHLRRAVNISRLLDMTTNAAATFEAALAAMASGAVLVNADMKIVYANPIAQRMLQAGDPIRTAAGRLELTQVLVPGQLSSRRHVNIPGVRVNLPAFTEKDRADTLVGIEEGIDFVALSFVREARDVEQLRGDLDRLRVDDDNRLRTHLHGGIAAGARDHVDVALDVQQLERALGERRAGAEREQSQRRSQRRRHRAEPADSMNS